MFQETVTTNRNSDEKQTEHDSSVVRSAKVPRKILGGPGGVLLCHLGWATATNWVWPWQPHFWLLAQ